MRADLHLVMQELYFLFLTKKGIMDFVQQVEWGKDNISHMTRFKKNLDFSIYTPKDNESINSECHIYTSYADAI